MNGNSKVKFLANLWREKVKKYMELKYPLDAYRAQEEVLIYIQDKLAKEYEEAQNTTERRRVERIQVRIHNNIDKFIKENKYDKLQTERNKIQEELEYLEEEIKAIEHILKQLLGKEKVDRLKQFEEEKILKGEGESI